jgi:hypothetical protein
MKMNFKEDKDFSAIYESLKEDTAFLHSGRNSQTFFMGPNRKQMTREEEDSANLDFAKKLRFREATEPGMIDGEILGAVSRKSHEVGYLEVSRNDNGFKAFDEIELNGNEVGRLFRTSIRIGTLTKEDVEEFLLDDGDDILIGDPAEYVDFSGLMQ